jgi:hypothetical protein
MTKPILSCVEEVATPRDSDANAGALTIRCYAYTSSAPGTRRFILRGDRELAAEAMTLLMRIDSELNYARADWNEDRFRRLMRLRSRAVKRLRRRWAILNPKPRIPLGTLRRRYHASLAGYLYQAKE